MKRYWRAAWIVAAAVAVMWAWSVQAAWVTNPSVNMRVTVSQQDQYTHRVEADTQGNYFVTWQHYDDVSGHEEAYAQKIDSNGNLCWGPDGVAICAGLGDKWGVRAAPDNNGGLIVAWQDGRRGSYDELYAQRLSSAGAELWTSDGLLVFSQESSSQSCPYLVSDAQGGAYVVWYSDNVYCQRLLPAGTLAWAAPVQLGTAGWSPKLAMDGAGGVLLTWQEDYLALSSQIMGQRLRPDGTKVWDVNNVLVCGADNYQQCPRIVSDGAGGALFTWMDRRDGTNRQVYAQRVSSSGTVMWTANGVCCYPYNSTSYGHAIACDGAGGAIVACMSGVDYNIHAARIDAAGSHVWSGPMQLSDDGYIDDISDSPCQLFPDGQGGAIYIYVHWNAIGQVRAQRVTGAGLLPWGANGLVLCDNPDAGPWCVRAAGCPTGNGVLAVWPESRGDALHAMGINYLGALGDPCSSQPAPTVTPVPSPGPTTWPADPFLNLRVAYSDQAEQYTHRIFSDATGNFFVTWLAGGEIPQRSDGVYAQKFDPTGNRMWGIEGLAVATGNGEFAGRGCSDGAGGMIIAWQDNRAAHTEIWAQRISSSGTAMWADVGVLVHTDPANSMYCPYLVPDGNGGAFMVYYGADVYCHRINGDGTLAWTAPVQLGVNGWSPKIAADGAGGVLLTWQEGTELDGSQIMAQRLTASGAKLWGETNLTVCAADDYQYCPRVLADGAGGGFFLWIDLRTDATRKLYLQKVSAAGVAAWAADGVCAFSGESASYGHAFVSDGAGGVIVTWLDAGDYNLKAVRISSTGALPWAGPVLLTDNGMLSDVSDSPNQLVSDGAGGAIAVYLSDDAEYYTRPFAQRVTNAGGLPWGINGIALSTSAMSGPSCVRVGGCPSGGGALACWPDSRDNGIYIQGINPEGSFGNPCGIMPTPTPAPVPASSSAGLIVLTAAVAALLAFAVRRR